MDELSVLESVEAGQAPASAARSVKDIPLGITRGMASDDYHAERSAVCSVLPLSCSYYDNDWSSEIVRICSQSRGFGGR